MFAGYLKTGGDANWRETKLSFGIAGDGAVDAKWFVAKVGKYGWQLFDFQAFHPVTHGAETDAEQFGGLGAVVAGLLQRLFDNQPFDVIQIVLYLSTAEYKPGEIV